MQELSSINVSDEPNGQNAPKKEQNAPPPKKAKRHKKGAAARLCNYS
jgi:hypothetical protein